MYKKPVEKKAPNDFKEPYEFRLLIGDNIICQRYFRIMNFNPASLSSIELTDTVRRCAEMINDDLKSKSRIYSWYMTPLVFNNEEEMRNWFKNPNNVSHSNPLKNVRLGENIMFKNEGICKYSWDGEKIIKTDKIFEDGTFTSDLTDKDIMTYEFAFYVNGKKIVSTTFDGIYPSFVRRNIDLSNTRGKFEGEDLSKLSFESYILNCLVKERPDLIKKIVREFCTTCSSNETKVYNKNLTFGKGKNKETYNLDVLSSDNIAKVYAKEIAKAEKYHQDNNYFKK
jgi:hypothetical protein